MKPSDQPYLTLSKIANKLNVVYPKLKYYNKYYCGKCGALESECKCGCEKRKADSSTKMQLYYYGVLDSNEKADFILNIYELYIYSKAKEKCSSVPDNIHPHLWRHTRAMHLYQHGMDLTLISQWLGHSNLETTLIYAHADTEHKRKAIEKAMNTGKPADEPFEPYTVSDEEILHKLYGL